MQVTSSSKIVSAEIQQETSLGSKLNILIETYSHLKCKSKMQFYPINFLYRSQTIFVYPRFGSFTMFRRYSFFLFPCIGA